VSRFRRVLTACAAAGLYQTVLDEGPITSELLRTTQEGGNVKTDMIPYVDRLVAGLQRAGQDRSAPTSGPRILSALSPRGTDILTLIAEGLGRSRRSCLKKSKSASSGLSSNIGLQLRENSVIVDQLATSIITMLAQLSRSRECPVRGHKPCKHWRDQFCGLTNRLSALVRQDFGISKQITMHSCREFDSQLHRLIVCDGAELKFCHVYLP
jgi:hypothetical protein